MFVGASETSVGSGTMVDHLWLAVTVTVGSVPSNSEGFSKSRFEGKAFPDDARFLTCVVRSPHSCGMQFCLSQCPTCHVTGFRRYAASATCTTVSPRLLSRTPKDNASSEDELVFASARHWTPSSQEDIRWRTAVDVSHGIRGTRPNMKVQAWRRARVKTPSIGILVSWYPSVGRIM